MGVDIMAAVTARIAKKSGMFGDRATFLIHSLGGIRALIQVLTQP